MSTSTDSVSAVPSDVDGVEIKVTLGADQVDAGLAAFALAAGAAERRRIWFCEYLSGSSGPTALPLLSRGVIVRVRKREDHRHDSTLKLRGPEGCIDPDAWRQRTRAFAKDARIEGDWVGDRHLLSASLDSHIEDGRIKEVLAERPPRVSRLLSQAQEDLAGEWLLGLGRLELLGPIRALKWDPGVEGLEHGIAAELWELDDRLRFLELSVREEHDPIGAQRRLEDAVRRAGLDFGSIQETKTRMVLEHLATAAQSR